jgi:hypothetical protein
MPVPSPRDESFFPYQALLVPTSRRSLWAGKDSTPHPFDPEDFQITLARQQKQQSRCGLPLVSYRHLEILAVPYVALYPSDFLSLLTPSDPASSSTSLPLRHLEITLLIQHQQTDQDLVTLASVFALLRHSLVHLSLRVVYSLPTFDDVSAISRTLSEGLKTCSNIERLGLGGMIDETAFSSVPTLAKLESLDIFPSDSSFNEFGLETIIEVLPTSLRSLNLCKQPAFGLDDDTVSFYRAVVERCQEKEITFRQETRSEESYWLNEFRP